MASHNERLNQNEYLNKVLCGDSAKVLSQLPDSCISLTLTSPPYDSLRTYQGFTFDFPTIAQELTRVTCPGGVIVWIVQDGTVNGSKTLTSFRQGLYFTEQCGLRMHDVMIRQKAGCNFPSKVRYWANWDFMFVLSKGKPRVVNLLADRPNKYAGQRTHGSDRLPDGSFKRKAQGKVTPAYGFRFNVWPVPHNKPGRFSHPASFSVDLAKDHIRSWSRGGDLVCDPFLGSGTAALAARQLNRNFTGIEISPTYCELAKSRLAQQDNQVALAA
jgi:site-specific DNA-methyltransferase (adenine-specific)